MTLPNHRFQNSCVDLAGRIWLILILSDPSLPMQEIMSVIYIRFHAFALKHLDA